MYSTNLWCHYSTSDIQCQTGTDKARGHSRPSRGPTSAEQTRQRRRRRKQSEPASPTSAPSPHKQRRLALLGRDPRQKRVQGGGVRAEGDGLARAHKEYPGLRDERPSACRRGHGLCPSACALCRMWPSLHVREQDPHPKTEAWRPKAGTTCNNASYHTSAQDYPKLLVGFSDVNRRTRYEPPVFLILGSKCSCPSKQARRGTTRHPPSCSQQWLKEPTLTQASVNHATLRTNSPTYCERAMRALDRATDTPSKDMANQELRCSTDSPPSTRGDKRVLLHPPLCEQYLTGNGNWQRPLKLSHTHTRVGVVETSLAEISKYRCATNGVPVPRYGQTRKAAKNNIPRKESSNFRRWLTSDKNRSKSIRRDRHR